MALPTVPTVISLLTEAYVRCGVPIPTAEQVTRAANEWFEDVKRDIAGRKKWHGTEETVVVIPQPYLQVYAMPYPFIRVLRMRFYRGETTGTATAGATSAITVATGTGNVQHRGLKIFLLSGTGEAQAGRITAVAGDVYTISCPWDTIPDNTTRYMIAEIEHPVHGPEASFPLAGIGPSTDLTYWDFIEQTLRFWPPLDDAGQYALELDGLVDLSLIDTQDARIVRLLREWREALVRGVMVHIKEDHDDLEDVDRMERKYEKAISVLMKQDTAKRLRAEAPAFRSIGGTVHGRRQGMITR